MTISQEGIKYKPDAVVLGFYANDYLDNVSSRLFSVQEGELKPESLTHIPGVKIQDFIYAVPFTQWLSENSYFYSLLFNRTWNLAKTMLRKVRQAEVAPDERAVAVSVPDNPYMLTLTEILLQRMARFCKENNILFIIADIPNWNSTGAVLSSIKPQLLDKLQEAADIVHYAPTVFAPFEPPPALGAYGPNEKKPLPFHRTHGHRHINPRAHKIIAEAVGRSIQSEHAKEDKNPAVSSRRYHRSGLSVT